MYQLHLRKLALGAKQKHYVGYRGFRRLFQDMSELARLRKELGLI